MLLPRLLRGAEGETLLLTTPPLTLPCPPVLSSEERQTPVRPRAFQGSPVHPVMHLDMPSVILLEKRCKRPFGRPGAAPSLQSHSTAEEKAFGKAGVGR